MSLLSYSKKKLHKAKINNFLGTTKRIDGAGEDHHHGIWIHRVTYIQSSQPDLLRNKVKRFITSRHTLQEVLQPEGKFYRIGTWIYVKNGRVLGKEYVKVKEKYIFFWLINLKGNSLLKIIIFKCHIYSIWISEMNDRKVKTYRRKK